jgi:hypothetical protein
LVEICVEGLLVFGVVHVSFTVVEPKESVQGGEIAGGCATDREYGKGHECSFR